jgi:hypothetical protein
VFPRIDKLYREVVEFPLVLQMDNGTLPPLKVEGLNQHAIENAGALTGVEAVLSRWLVPLKL